MTAPVNFRPLPRVQLAQTRRQRDIDAQSTIGVAICRVNRGLWSFDEIRLDFYRESQ